MADPEQFAADLDALSFRLVQERPNGVRQYVLQASPYPSYAVHWNPREDTVLFTWEFGIGEFMSERGLQIGSNEELNSFLYPKFDARGEQDIAFVVQEMDRTEALLRALDFLEGG